MWTVVYVGNFIGAIATAGLTCVTRHYRFGGGVVGEQALAIASAKVELGFTQAVVLGAFCNALVCLGVWLTYSVRTTADKILAVFPPIAAFVASGFEHNVANMYLHPVRDPRPARTIVACLSGRRARSLGPHWGSFVADKPSPGDDRE